MINAITLAMSSYLQGLFMPSITITTTEELLNCVSANTDFVLAISAFVTQDFSSIHLTIQDDIINFNFLNKISNGEIGKIADIVQKLFTDENGRTLFGASSSCSYNSMFTEDKELRKFINQSFKRYDNFLSRCNIYDNFYTFNFSIIMAHVVALREQNIKLSNYKYNLNDSMMRLAFQYQEIKQELLTDKEFIEYLNCNNNLVLAEQIIMVILNKAMLSMALDLSARYTNALVLFSNNIYQTHLTNAIGSIFSSSYRDIFRVDVGNTIEAIHYYKNKFSSVFFQSNALDKSNPNEEKNKVSAEPLFEKKLSPDNLEFSDKSAEEFRLGC
jgi:hypothetical protein